MIECLKTALSLSNVRCQLLNKNWDEESKQEFAGLSKFGEIIAYFGANKVGEAFKRELRESFKIAKEKDDAIKAKKGAANAKADAKKKPKKNAAPAPPPGIQLGRGSRAFFDFLAQSTLLADAKVGNFNAALNKELQGELTEML